MVGKQFRPGRTRKQSKQGLVVSAFRKPTILTRPLLHEALWRERARTDRNGSPFSLTLIRLHRQGGAHAHETSVLDQLLGRMRWTDQIGWFNERYLGLIMPDTQAEGAWIFAQRFRDALVDEQPKPECRVYTYPSQWLDGERDGGGGEEDGGTGGTGGMGDGQSGPDFQFDQAGLEVLFGERKAAPHHQRSVISDSRLEDPTIELVRDIDSLAGDKSSLTRSSTVLVGEDVSIDRMQANFSASREGSLESLMTEPMRKWKRPLDICGGLIGLVLCSPLMLVLGLLVRGTSRGPMLFRQRRCGLGGRPFTIFKFRTMVADAEQRRPDLAAHSEQDGPAFKMDRDPRTTVVGRFLRKTSLDELPQLINVLRGEMSLVGPRPLPVAESNGCLPWQRRRLTVKPGITCLWQVNGRSTVNFDQWMRLDHQYVRRLGLVYDLWLMTVTIPAVLLQRGAK